MESGPESLQPLEHGVAAGPAPGTGSPQEGRQETRLAAGDGPGVWAAESSGGKGQGVAAAGRSLSDSASPAGSPRVLIPCSSLPDLDLKGSDLESPAAQKAPLTGQHKVTASPEAAEAGADHELVPAGEAGALADRSKSGLFPVLSYCKQCPCENSHTCLLLHMYTRIYWVYD